MFDIQCLNETEKKYVNKILGEFAKDGSSETYNKLIKSEFIREPVSAREFFTSDYYYGKGWQKIYPIWVEELCYVCNPLNEVTEWVISGSLGGGKTTVAMRCLMYKLYEMSCLLSPQDFYGIIPGHKIVFFLYNIFKYKATSTTFPILKSMIDNSPYFNEIFKNNAKGKTKIEFLNHVEVLTGANTSDMIGDNLFVLVIDEANFMKGGSDPEESRAFDIYSSALTRMESRFITARQSKPWLLIIVSSKKHETDFTSQRIAYLKKKGYGCRVSEFPIWALKNPDTYGKKTFRVLIGDSLRPSRILPDNEIIPTGMEIIDVPLEYKEPFVINPEKALNDIAGISTLATRPFITRKESIEECIGNDRRHPFFTESVYSNFKGNDPIEDYIDIDLLTRIENSRRVPRVNPHVARQIHVDTGLTGDSLGFVMGHPASAKLVSRVSIDGNIYQSQETIVYIDLMLQVVPEGEIDLTSVRMLIVFINQVLGYNISGISYDGFQSRESIQLLKKLGYDVELLSVDRNVEPYSILQRAILEGRLNFYSYAPMLKELANLIWDKERNKIDHPNKNPDGTKGSKDITDGLASCTYKCIREDATNTFIPSELPDISRVKQEQQDLNLVNMPQNPVNSIDDISWVYGDANKTVKQSLDKFFKK